jgi:arylsulfatase A-like enzyme
MDKMLYGRLIAKVRHGKDLPIVCAVHESREKGMKKKGHAKAGSRDGGSPPGGAPPDGTPPGTKPNVILIMSDEHRADALGCMGNPIIQTPNLDRLAQRGIIFDSAFVQCPVCMASRGAIHTGRYPQAIRIRSMGLLPPTEVTLAETLKRAGYVTGMFGKLHFTPQTYTRREIGSEYPIIDAGVYLEPSGIQSASSRAAVEDPYKKTYGFDVHVGVEDSLWGPYLDWLEKEAPELVPAHCSENWSCARGGTRFNGPPARRQYDGMGDFFDSNMPGEMHPSAFIVDQTLAFIRKHSSGAKRDDPFFAHCSFVDPHSPFNAPTPFSRLYAPADMPVPPAPEQTGFYGQGLPKALLEIIEQRNAYPDELWQGGLANYYGMISHIDWCVGRLLEGLEELGVSDNTLIVFTSDHGEYIGDHRLLYKGSLMFDGEVRAPLIFAWADGIAGGRRIPFLVQEIDIYPTLMALLGLECHPGVQGMDLSGAILRSEDLGYEHVYCELDQLPTPAVIPAQMIRSEDCKLIYFPLCQEGMLFQMEEDPLEMHNLYYDSAYTAVKQRMLSHLLDRIYVAKDPLPIRLSQA